MAGNINFTFRNARLGIAALAVVLVAALCFITGCPQLNQTPAGPAATLPAAAFHWTWSTARHQISFIPMPMDLPGTVAFISVLNPTGPGNLNLHAFELLAQHSSQTSFESPVADQLTGSAHTISDNGSVLLPTTVRDTYGQRKFTVPASTAGWFLRLDVNATVQPGLYHIPILIGLTGAERQTGQAVNAMLEVEVSNITLPMEPAVLAIATCTTSQLAATYRSTFGVIQGQNLDRGEPDAALPMAQLDALIQTAHTLGLNFYVEDLIPTVNVDEVGRVNIDWDAYDRTMGPYIDGTGFSDRTGNAVWLVPVPPRRVRDVPAQLRQYWQACLEHAKDRAWAAIPALLHPALQDPAANPQATNAALRVVRDSISKDVLVVAAPELDIPQKKIWTTQDDNPQLPSIGAYATAQSVRIWPWMTKARNLGGFLWPNCLGTAGGNDSDHIALLIPTVPPSPVDKNETALLVSEPQLALRMAWLNAGINDLAHFVLLEKRSDPARAAEVLAAIAGRTGLGDATSACPDETWQSNRTAFLYAGWPAGAETWDALDGRLDQLIVAGTPGATVKIAEDDPSYLKTKIWLAKSHQLIARLGGYRFAVQPGRDGAVLRFSTDMLIENPINLQTPIAVHLSELPGDFQSDTLANFSIDPYALATKSLVMQGHMEPLHDPHTQLQLTLQEKNGNADVNLPMPVPVFKMRATREPPKIDASRKDWPEYAGPYQFMPVGLRYLSRPDILTGKLRTEATPATVRWSYDSDYIYALIQCPQALIDDERNNDWPEEIGRWWGTDGLQIHLAGGAKIGDNAKIVEIAIKPSGAVLLRQAVLQKDKPVKYGDIPTGVRYSIHADGTGYVAEMAIPRKLFPVDHDVDQDTPVWRVNVLRHIHQGSISTSWSGPVRDDADFSMMGLLVGTGE